LALSDQPKLGVSIPHAIGDRLDWSMYVAKLNSWMCEGAEERFLDQCKMFDVERWMAASG
jgi:hypothetical protein